MNDDWMTEDERALLTKRNELGNAAMQLGIRDIEELARMACFYHTASSHATSAVQMLREATRNMEYLLR